jgi:hypothetical protein
MFKMSRLMSKEYGEVSRTKRGRIIGGSGRLHCGGIRMKKGAEGKLPADERAKALKLYSPI